MPRPTPAPSPDAPPVHRASAARRAGELALCLVAFLLAFAQPLADPDLGTRLRTADWMLAHGRLPRVEPFAWTRAGAPFHAYAWLAELAYRGALAVGGAVGLRLVHGATYAAATAAVLLVARVRRLPGFAAALLAAGHLVVLWATTPYLRPQAMLAVAVPLCWAAALRLAAWLDAGAAGAARAPDDAAPRWPWPTLVGASALAANTHLLAPLCLAPLAVLVPRLLVADHLARRVAGRVVGAAVLALAAGLLATPNAWHWPAMLQLNLAPNALITHPTPVAEYRPGVAVHLAAPDLSTAVVLLLLALPWCLAGAMTQRNGLEASRHVAWSTGQPVAGPVALAERVLTGVSWTAGAVLFALAVKGVWAWWLLALPLTAGALVRLPVPPTAWIRRAATALAAAAGLVPGLVRALDPARGPERHPDLARRALPTPAAPGALGAADALDRVAPGGCGRLVTTFEYGSALLWRLPRYSLSVDGRTIFPDSIARGELLPDAGDGPPSAGLDVADGAILPAGHRTGRALAGWAGWRLAARVPGAELWLRRAPAGRDAAPATVALPDLARCDLTLLRRAAERDAIP